MRVAIVVEVFPFGQFLFEVHVVVVAQKLIELFLISPVGAFHLAVFGVLGLI